MGTGSDDQSLILSEGKHVIIVVGTGSDDQSLILNEGKHVIIVVGTGSDDQSFKCYNFNKLKDAVVMVDPLFILMFGFDQYH